MQDTVIKGNIRKSTLLSAVTYYSVRISTYKYSVWYLGISTSAPAGIKKYLSEIQILSNVYLKVLKYKYSYTWPHFCMPHPLL